jgi:hypothetical protein
MVADEYRSGLLRRSIASGKEEIAVIARDLRGWLRRTPKKRAGSRATSSCRSACRCRRNATPEASARVLIDGRFKLRGAVDLVEEHQQTGVLRVTDHKTGRTARRTR